MMESMIGPSLWREAPGSGSPEDNRGAQGEGRERLETDSGEGESAKAERVYNTREREKETWKGKTIHFLP